MPVGLTTRGHGVVIDHPAGRADQDHDENQRCKMPHNSPRYSEADIAKSLFP
jgi:hypothetical protein